MPDALQSESPNKNQTDANEAAPKPPRIKITRPSEDAEKKNLNKRLKDVEICVPIVYGTISFWLGKKASEALSHKWTVYVRGATNEDISVVVKRVVFQLHPSFHNPVRVIDSPPFELSECGWGEFEIGISIFFHNDLCEKQLDLFHHLKLYGEDESGPQSTKKPVVVETYNEIVFPDPPPECFARVQSHPAVIVPRLPGTIALPPAPVEDVHEKKKGDTKDHPLSQWFSNFSEADELLKLAAARQQGALLMALNQIYFRGITLTFDFWKVECNLEIRLCRGQTSILDPCKDEPSTKCGATVQNHIIKLRRQLSMIDGPSQTLKPASGQ